VGASCCRGGACECVIDDLGGPVQRQSQVGVRHAVVVVHASASSEAHLEAPNSRQN